MKKRLFLFTTLITFAGLLAFFAASVYMTYTNNMNNAKSSVMEIAQIYAGLYNNETDLSWFVRVGNDTRVTVISPDGAVLADSRPLDLEVTVNHLTRPEVQAARDGSPTAYVRYSESLGVDFIYYALKHETDSGYVYIRAAIPVAQINAYLFQSLPLLILLFFIIVFFCLLLSQGMIKKTIKPFESVESKLRLLSSGKYVSEPVAKSYEEIDIITKSIDEIAQILQGSFDSLREEKNKVEYILNNIGDGIFAVNESKNITMINSAALDIFDAKPDITNKNASYLFHDNILTAAIDDCVTHEQSAFVEFAFQGRIYLVTVKRLPETKITMVVLSDITDSRESEKRREEFFANASHELKTPLTAIKGFNELTAINNKDENINKYIESITRETDRMLSLIGDMLKLSELENAQITNLVPVSLATVTNEVCETLSAAINEKSITINIIGDGTIKAKQEHVYELIKNLVENAVRYNDQNGKISVTIESNKRNTWLYVFDDGIGISPGEQTRIFERFYRVEKSRSQRGGGTGLGLSIVKHICALYGWKLSLKSKLGVGTEITVTFVN